MNHISKVIIIIIIIISYQNFKQLTSSIDLSVDLLIDICPNDMKKDCGLLI